MTTDQNPAEEENVPVPSSEPTEILSNEVDAAAPTETEEILSVEVQEPAPAETVEIISEEVPDPAPVETVKVLSEEVQEPAPVEIVEMISKEVVAPAPVKEVEYPLFDLAVATKDNFLTYFGKIKEIASAHAHAATYKKVDEITKEVKEAWNQLKQAEKQAAIEAFKSANEGSDEGFDFKDEAIHAVEQILASLRTEKQAFFQTLEKAREKALEGKTRLINELRTLVDADDYSDPAHVNASFKAFKKIQEEWKGLGSVQGPMNQTLWQSYHALVDRFYSNRSIFYELLELDRKKNLQAKEIIAAKLEKLAASVAASTKVPALLKEAEELFNEYKHIGPAQREENEAMWQRVKKSLDVLFEQKRQINDANKAVFEENLKIKKELGDLMHTYAAFQSATITEWNQASKAVLAIQEQWGKLKGGMPRDGGKDVSHQFWADLKLFFKHKSEFFSKIDAERKANLAAKQLLIEQVEGIVAVGTDTAEITQQVIELQKKWKDIGHVPEKQKDSIYTKFKAACDAYFNLKRSASKGAKDEEFEANLVAKQAILTEMAAMLTDPSSLAKLGTIKANWDAIGFVPRRDVKTIQESFRNSWNALIDLARTQPKEQLAAWGFELKSLKNESASSASEGSAPSADNRKKIQTLENDIAVLTNNLEFFAKSKNSDKLRADVEKKIEAAEKELEKLKKS
jgi:hypothetical protein